jgi:ankyrin repeat protein
MKTVSDGNDTIVSFLLEKGANPNVKVTNPQGFCNNALQAAAEYGREHAALILLNHGADIHAGGGDYGNALQAAIACDYIKTIALLLSRGARLDAPGAQWDNMLERLRRERGPDSVELLKQAREMESDLWKYVDVVKERQAKEG